MHLLTAGQVAFASAIVQQRLHGEPDNVTAAYRLAFPDATESTAQAAGSRTSRNINVVAEIRRQLTAVGITLPYIQGGLVEAFELAKAKKDIHLVNETGMNLLKSAGLITDKQEITTMRDEQKDALVSLLNRTMPSLIPAQYDKG